jgi:citrate synthase
MSTDAQPGTQSEQANGQAGGQAGAEAGGQADGEEAGQAGGPGVGQGARSETLTVTDNRTGRSYELPIEDGTVRATELRQIKVEESEFGMMAYDPAFMNTASCRSAITYIDGDAGVLQHRGYPIEQLCEHSTYLEVAYLLINGRLPSRDELSGWVDEITIHTFVHENIKDFMQGFRYDANPMGMLVASVGALSTFYPDANQIHEERVRAIQIIRLLAKMPTLAAFAFRHNMGQPYVYPDNDLNYAGNFLGMMYKMTELKYEPDPRLERALDVLFILHADHEQNASTSAVRSVGSTQVDPYTAVAAGVAALYGPLHGGANEAALRMLKRIETVENIPDFLAGVKEGNERLMGFGHRVYKNYDPRARIIRKYLDDVFEVRGKSPLLEVATELEKRALDDDYFTSRKLYPNVDFYSGLIYEALGLPVAMFPVMFAIGRTSGWIAQWLEMVQDSEQKIARPRQIYTGERDLDYVPIEQRS